MPGDDLKSLGFLKVDIILQYTVMNTISASPFTLCGTNQAKILTKWFSGSLLTDQTLLYLGDKHPDFNVETSCCLFVYTDFILGIIRNRQ